MAAPTRFANLTDNELMAEAQHCPGGPAEQEAVLRYEALVVQIVDRCRLIKHANTEDAMNEGRIALVNAVRTFSPEKGAKFITYAHICITNAVRRFGNAQHVIRIPEGAALRGVEWVEVYSVDTRADTWRWEQHERGMDEIDFAHSLAARDDDLDLVPLRVDVERALSGITADVQKVVLRAVMAGRTLAEVAAELKVSKQRVHEALRLARLAMAEALSEEMS